MFKMSLKYLRYLKPYWVAEVFVLLISIITTVLELINPYLLKIVIDDAITPKNMDLFIRLLILMVILMFVGLIIRFINTYLFNLISNKIMLDIRSDIFNHIIYLPVTFFNNQKIGDLVQKINNEVNLIGSFVTQSLLRVIRNAIMIVGLVFALCYLNVKLFLMIAAVTPFILLNLKYFQPKIKKVMEEIRKKDSEILNFFIERFQQVKLIQAFNIFEVENNKLVGYLRERIKLAMKRVKLSAVNNSIMTLLISININILIAVGGYFIIKDMMTIGALLAFLNYLMLLINPLRDSQSLYMEIVRISVSMERINEIFGQKVIGYTNGEKKLPFSFKDHISFRDVSFKYDNTQVLSNVNFGVRRGKTYALVGPSGSGKTTIISLLLGFFEPESGEIQIDQNSLQDIDIFSLRENISYISQDHQLFNDSIIENIRIGNLDSTDEEVIETSKKVNIYKHICSLEEKFNARVGDQGTKLSGGEKQRISIARAFLKNADILILDEVFASLDSESEKIIFKQLKEKYNNSAIIVISHRLSTIKEVDEIICLKDGSVAEKGSPYELIEKKGDYWNLFRDQMENGD